MPHKCAKEDVLDRIEEKLDIIHDKVLTHRLIFDISKWMLTSSVPVVCVFLGYWLTKK